MAAGGGKAKAAAVFMDYFKEKLHSIKPMIERAAQGPPPGRPDENRPEPRGDLAESFFPTPPPQKPKPTPVMSYQGLGNIAVGGMRSIRGGLEGFGDPEGMIETGRAEGGFFGGLKAGGGQLVQSMEANRSEFSGIGQAMRGSSEMLGKGIGDIPGLGPVGKVIEEFGKLGAVVVETIDRLKTWTNALHQSNMQFAEFSGAMAGVQARQQVRDIQLSRARGERRAESAEYLASGKASLERGMAPFEDKWGDIKNYIGGFFGRLLGDEGLLGKVAEIGVDLKLLSKGKIDPVELDNWLKEAAKMAGAWEDHGRPRRF